MIDWGFDDDDDCLPHKSHCRWDQGGDQIKTDCGGDFLLDDDY